MLFGGADGNSFADSGAATDDGNGLAREIIECVLSHKG